MAMDRIDALRGRIVAALGVALLLPIVAPPGKVRADTGSTGDTGQPAVTEVCQAWNEADGPCPAAADAEPVSTCTFELLGEGTFADGSCCYPAKLTCPPPANPNAEGCCYGRPYVDERGHAVAGEERTDRWAAEPLAPRLSDLSPSQRERLARHWATAGLAEHSSVAGFARVVLDLVACGAPADLVIRAQQAGIDESNHARLCFALATAYAGRPIGPGPVPLGPTAPVCRTYLALALSTAKEGCVGETVGAHVAAVLRDRATDPAVRSVLARIASEEAEHAALAWATVRWAVEQGGEEVRAALREAFAPPRSRFGDGAAFDPRVAAHGLVPDEALASDVEDVLTRVIGPAVAALLG